MTPFALMLPPNVRAELPTLFEVIFIGYVLISFIYVGLYTSKQVRTGKLFTAANAPLPVVMSPMPAWFLVISVVVLIYLGSVLYAIIVLVGIAGMLAESRRTWRDQFGLNRLRPGQVVGWSVLIFGAIMLVEEPLTGASNWALDVLRVPHPEQQNVETFRHYNDPLTIFFFMLEAVFLWPMIEELFFRGFLLTFLKNYTTTWGAIILSAGVFAFAHLNLGAVMPLWLLGIVLGVAYEHTGSLAVPFGVHACFNLATALSLLLEKANPS